jgi:hypothetical protein
MAEIPTVVAPRLAPPPEMSPEIAGEPGRELARLGQEFGQVADYGLAVTEKIRQAQTTLALAQATNQIKASLDRYHETLAKSGDPDNLPNPQAFVDELKNSFEDNPKYSDPRVKRALDLHIEAVGEDARHLTLMRQLTLQKGQWESALITNLDTTAHKMASDIPGSPEWEKDRGDFEILSSKGVASGWSNPKEHATWMKRLDAAAEEYRIGEASVSQNPERIQAMIDETNEHSDWYKDLNPKEFETQKHTLQIRLEQAQALHSKIEVEAAGNQVIADYGKRLDLIDPRTHKTDWRTAAEQLDEDSKVPEPVKDYARIRFRERANDQEAVTRKANREVITHYAVLSETGELSSQQVREIEQQLKTGQIDEGVGLAIIGKNAQVQREKMRDSREAQRDADVRRRVESSDLRDSLIDAAGDGYIPEEVLQKNIKVLTHADYRFLHTAKSVNADPAWREAVSVINHSMMFGDTEIDENKIKMSDFMNTFEKEVEDQHLHGPQITEALNKDMTEYVKKNSPSLMMRLDDWYQRTVTGRSKEPEQSAGTSPNHKKVVERRLVNGRVAVQYDDGSRAFEK